jgi:hypothetical protein
MARVLAMSIASDTKAKRKLGFLLRVLVPLACWTRRSCMKKLIPAILWN